MVVETKVIEDFREVWRVAHKEHCTDASAIIKLPRLRSDFGARLKRRANVSTSTSQADTLPESACYALDDDLLEEV